MKKNLGIIFGVLIILAAGFLIYRNFAGNDGAADADLEAMKQNMASAPIINNPNLTDQQKKNFLDRFENSKKIALDMNFDTLQGLNEMAVIKKAVGDLEGAKVIWEYLNIIRPSNSLSFANLAALYHYDLNDYKKAEGNYLLSLKNDPDDIPTIRNFFELYYYALKDNQKAESFLLDSISKNPTAIDLYSLAGKFYQDIGNKEKAIEYYQKHLELNPGNAAVQREMDNLKK